MRSLRLETLRDFSDLQQLASAWHGLCTDVSSATPFQSPVWLIPWWKHFHPGDLYSLAMHDGEELVAIFPFYIELKPTGKRELKCVGCCNSDYLDPLIRLDCEHEVCDALTEWLSANRDRFDKCVFHRLRERSPLTRVLPPQAKVSESDPCLRRQLPTTKEEWRSSISPNLNANIRHLWHRAERQGRLRMEYGTASNLSGHLSILFSLHNRRWSAKRQPGAVFDQTVESFLSETALGFAAEQMLRSAILWWNDQPVAVVYGFSHLQTFYFYLTGLEPRFAKFSFGSLAINAAIEAAIDRGCHTVDFLRGREPYKYRFGATEKRIITLSCPAKALQLDEHGEKDMARAALCDKIAQ